ncbi:transcription factor Cys6 [Fusarium phyllophilum]|uniref:Transcription factor Cys6 n=1 Tax=Fusarium phyllophilum TaxID=47803 RepID=A0A8H5NJ71_9HYPO|nr:transcription factor Cys6 [Fusarium phyllophilum]
MDSNQERMPIAHNVRNVLKSFRTVATSFSHEIDSLGDQAGSHSLRELLPTLENENIRFKMWAGNLGAHQSGPASLDHRLREAPHIQEQVIYLLRDISESLEDTIVFIPQREPPKGSADIEDKPECLPEGSDSDSEDSFTDSDLDDENISPHTKLSTLCTDIAEAIDCLLRLSLAIANPAPHERFRKLGAGPDEDISFYEAHDIRYVQDKFPKISQDLPDVLGKFITRRRQFFKYRESHHAKLAAGLDQETQKDTGRTEIVPNTVASSLPEHFKGSGVIDEDNRSDMAMSETSYATSAGYLMLEDGEIKPAPPLKVPPRPPEADKGVFECPFCYRMISASTRGAWKRHVFGDLRPYTCLFSRCTESNTDFDRRHRWRLHVSQYHWRTWSCPFKCGNTFPSAVELGDHIRLQHLPNASDEHLSTVVARGEVSVSNGVTQECPLCRRAISGLKSYVKHVGRHLEQLALHALPKIGDEELEDYVESGEQNNEASELSAISAENDSETSSKAEDNQAESSGPNTMTVGYDGEANITAGEVLGGDAPMPSNASPISSGQHEREPNETQKLLRDRDIAMGLMVEGMSKVSKEWEETRDVSESLKWLRENIPMKYKAKVEESAGNVEQAPVGFKEHEQPPTDPSEVVGPAAQDSRPTYTRFARRHLSIETLREFNLNFDFDTDPDYVLVKQWVPEWEQDRMWKHTKLIREKRTKTLLEETPVQSGELKYEYEWDFTAIENADMEAKERENRKRLEDDLQKSGLDEVTIAAILKKEKVRRSKVPEG